MKIQTNLVRITPYFMFLQQAKDNMDFIRASVNQIDMMPMQFGGLTGQLATLDDRTILEITEFDGSERTDRVIAPTLLR